MKLIIEIPKFVYDMIKATNKVIHADSEIVGEAILNGTPLPKGHWIEHENCYECSNCGIIRAKGKTGLYNYCPNCGAEMEVGHDS